MRSTSISAQACPLYYVHSNHLVQIVLQDNHQRYSVSKTGMQWLFVVEIGLWLL